MITPRLPLYIVCLYVHFFLYILSLLLENSFLHFSFDLKPTPSYSVLMYLTTTAAHCLHLPPLAEAAATGLFAMIFYGVYDIAGPRFLWWTWHDTDVTIGVRLFGAPMGSTCWMLTYTACHNLLHYWFRRPVSNIQKIVPHFGFILDEFHRLVYWLSSPLKIAATALLCTPMFTLFMGFLQIFALDTCGIPDYRTMGLCIAIYVGLIFKSWTPGISGPKMREHHLATGVSFYFVMLVFIMAWGVPERHLSTGTHEVLGGCSRCIFEPIFHGLYKAQVCRGDPHDVKSDIMGNQHGKYMCPESYEEDYEVVCPDELVSLPASRYVAPSSSSPDWYTVCGKAHSNFEAHMGVVASLSAIGIYVFLYAFGCFGFDSKNVSERAKRVEESMGVTNENEPPGMKGALSFC
jgi:hypothetical protein